MKKSILVCWLSFIVFKSLAQAPEFVSKLKERAIPIDSNLSFSGSDNVKGQKLLKELNSYKALGLGEATHGTHEFFVAKENLIKLLLPANHYDRISLEAPYAEVEDMNQYILHGTGEVNAILKTFRQYTYETKEFVDLVNYIKEYNSTKEKKILFYGADFQSPYKALKNFHSEIKNSKALLATDSLIFIFDKLNNALYSHGINAETYRNICRISEQMYLGLQNTKDSLVLKSLKNYKQFLILNAPAKSGIDLQKLSIIRDSLMAANIVGEINNGHFMLVWAHNGHIQKSANVFSKSTGQHLFEKLKAGYGVIGLTTYKGFYTGFNNNEQAVVKTNPLVVPNQSQTEYFLNLAGYKNYIVNTAGLTQPPGVTAHRFIGYGVTDQQFPPGDMFSSFDYIFFISTTRGSFNNYLKKM